MRNEIQVAGQQTGIKLRPYEHHAKYYDGSDGHHSSQQLCEMDGRSENGSDGSDGAEL